jgi:hypothetical protein
MTAYAGLGATITGGGVSTGSTGSGSGIYI